ncbi:MAG: ABC transporter permease, partial [Vicinamibacteria bacterium]|nr:ABC transporter permease [Vicinamibacteria bacterium]
MPSPRPAWTWLLEKEWRELLSSRAFWVMLFLTGPLVGVSFISAVNTYAELSGLNGTAAGVGEAFSPLIGIWGPTFSAYEIVAAF